MNKIDYYYYEDIKDEKEIVTKTYNLKINTYKEIDKYITSQVTEMPCKNLILNFKMFQLVWNIFEFKILTIVGWRWLLITP